jgi:hypothetical protein
LLGTVLSPVEGRLGRPRQASVIEGCRAEARSAKADGMFNSALSRSHLRLAAIVALIALAVACSSRTPTSPGPVGSPQPTRPIMGASRLTASQLVAWTTGRSSQPAGTYSATIPLPSLAQIYVEEGALEGVTGDIAFVQSVIETGWFRFGGLVSPAANNFAGIGATDSGGTPASFADARTGVRAQIQHLRAYADATALTCAIPPLSMPCVDPRFHLVLPKGRAPTWNQLGSGNWASAAGYGSNIVNLYQDALRFHGTE